FAVQEGLAQGRSAPPPWSGYLRWTGIGRPATPLRSARALTLGPAPDQGELARTSRRRGPEPPSRPVSERSRVGPHRSPSAPRREAVAPVRDGGEKRAPAPMLHGHRRVLAHRRPRRPRALPPRVGT